MSSGPDRGNSPMRSSQSAGFRFSKYAPVVGATHSPATKLGKRSGIAGLVRRGVGAEPRGGYPRVADARQDRASAEHEAPNDQELRQEVRHPEATPPRRQAAPNPGR